MKARGAVEQFENIETRYLSNRGERPVFSVSMQYYTIAVNAFIDTVKEYDLPEYQYFIRETQTGEVIEDVKTLRSEVGVIALSDFNKNTFKKYLQMLHLNFMNFLLETHTFI